MVADEGIKQGDFVIEYVGEGIYIYLLFVKTIYSSNLHQEDQKKGKRTRASSLIFWLFPYVQFILLIVIDDKTCEERLWNMKGRGNTNFYLCEVSHDMVIDATNKGNKSRFINHSCEPNTEMQKWYSLIFHVLLYYNLISIFYQ